jgi:hypothetical protein
MPGVPTAAAYCWSIREPIFSSGFARNAPRAVQKAEVNGLFASMILYAASRSVISVLIFATRTDFAMPKNLRILI